MLSPHPRVVFISRYNHKVASYRFRVEKLLPLLSQQGIDIHALQILPYEDWRKIPALVRLLRGASSSGTIVVFQKMISFWLAHLSRLSGASLCTDWDDGGSQRIDGSAYPGKYVNRMARWIRLMDATIVSCEELRGWVSPWTDRPVHIIPTCLDVEAYTGRQIERSSSPCVIGWVGGKMSRSFLLPVEAAMMAVTQNTQCKFLVVGGDDPELDCRINSRFVQWKLELEPAVFGEFDIGIMPLPDNERARMKAGFKLLQYMSAGLPVVATPLGVNRDIVVHGWNGYHAETTEEWIHYLTLLANNPALRQELGQNGQRFAYDHYRLDTAAQQWREIILTTAVPFHR